MLLKRCSKSYVCVRVCYGLNIVAQKEVGLNALRVI
jgi:hypothetical protein